MEATQQMKADRARAVANRNKAMAHPLRSTVFRIITERVASPAEIARELFEDVSNVGYHMKRLVELECAELVDTRPVRGAVEHFYRATELHLVRTDDWASMPETARTHLLAEFLQPAIDDFESSIRAGILGSDERWAVTRTRHVLDAKAYDEALLLHEAFIQSMERLREESANRLATSGEKPVHASSTVNFFKVPAL